MNEWLIEWINAWYFSYVRMENIFSLSSHLPNFYPKLRRVLKYKGKKFCCIVIREIKRLSCVTFCCKEFISTMPICGQISHMNIMIHTGCFTTCGHYCRTWFPRSFWSKNLTWTCVRFWMVTELWPLETWNKR